MNKIPKNIKLFDHYEKYIRKQKSKQINKKFNKFYRNYLYELFKDGKAKINEKEIKEIFNFDSKKICIYKSDRCFCTTHQTYHEECLKEKIDYFKLFTNNIFTKNSNLGSIYEERLIFFKQKLEEIERDK